MLDLICARLRSLTDVDFAGEPVSGLVLGIDRDPLAKVTLLLFDRRGTACAVAKVAREPGSEPALHREYEALARLGREPTEVSRQVPRPLLLERLGGRLVLATTALPGGPLSVDYYTPGHVSDPELVRRDFTMAGRWLAEFQQATVSGTVRLGDELVERHVRPVLRRYLDLADEPEGEEREACELILAAAGRLPAGSAAVGPVHGDFAIGNLLVRRGRLCGVVDWEQSIPCGVLLTDVLKFAASYSCFLDRAAPPRHGSMPGHQGWADAARRWPPPSDWPNHTGFLYGFHGDGWYPELVRAFVAFHADRLGLPPEAVPVLLATFAAEQATVLRNPAYAEGYRQLFRVLAPAVRRAERGGGRP